MTPTRRPAADQRVRHEAATRLGHSYLLEAGAGTGKTTVLLDRVTEILKTNILLERIAVITFTEKAAGELKLRLRRGMEEMIGAAEAGSGWEAHLKRSLESLDRATVSTIHSFAASLLRERPIEANIDPRFAVADQLGA
ncbi:MAG TPA: UvrD-helicase domain-containing protein, partial [Patescibacteria group bacterium]|nr:UvrD-helicase domain-containing protein [Patescibacteria group bacterium]